MSKNSFKQSNNEQKISEGNSSSKTSNGVEELEKNKKLTEQGPAGKDLYEERKKQKEQNKKKERRGKKLSEAPKKLGRYIFYILIAALIVGGLGLLVASRSKLPPTSMEGHIEQSPPSHIVNTPMPDNIQRHMLEHADGEGDPGIIIQYNCSDFDCAPDLLSRLTELVNDYPENVYLGPNNYDGKIILTKLGKRKVLGEFDEEAIVNFIGR